MSISYFGNKGSSGGPQIGDAMLHPSKLPKITKPNQEEWLRCGILASAASYPVAATLQYLRVYGNKSTVPSTYSVPSSNGPRAAHNGSGTWVVATGSASVFVSTDNGQTWTAVTSNNTNAPTDVVWTGSRFVTFGNSTTQITCSHSTTGASFTAGGSAAVSSATANTAQAEWNGSIALCVCRATTTSQAASTTDGTTVTARTLSQQLNNDVSIGVAGTTFVMGGQNTNWVTSTNGTSFSNQVGPVGLATERNFSRGGGPFLLIFPAGSTFDGTYYTTTDGLTYTARTMPGFNATIEYFTPGCQPYWTGSRYVANSIHMGEVSTYPGGEFIYSTDGLDWSVDQISYGIERAPGMKGIVAGNGTVLFSLSDSLHGAYSSTYPATPQWVGRAHRSATSTTSAESGEQLETFVRIK